MNITMIARNRAEAANSANRDDAALWRWFCLMYEDRRLRWCASGSGWLVSVDHRHLATEFDFDAAIRSAEIVFKRMNSGLRNNTCVGHRTGCRRFNPVATSERTGSGRTDLR